MLKNSCIYILSLMSLSGICMVSTTPAPAPAPTPTPAPERVQVLKLPQDIPTCPEDANVNECIRHAFNTMLRNTGKGIPELNIPPIDPLEQDRLNVQFSNNIIRGRAAVRNVRIAGLSRSSFRQVQYQRQGNQIKLMVDYHAPRIQIEGLYKAEVQLSDMAKFTSKGTFNISMIDIQSKSEHYAELYERNGHTYMRLTKVNLDPTLGDMVVAATGLVPDPLLNNALLQIVNDNWRPLYKSIISATRSTWEPILLDYSNDFFSHLPFDFIITNNRE